MKDFTQTNVFDWTCIIFAHLMVGYVFRYPIIYGLHYVENIEPASSSYVSKIDFCCFPFLFWILYYRISGIVHERKYSRIL